MWPTDKLITRVMVDGVNVRVLSEKGCSLRNCVVCECIFDFFSLVREGLKD